MFDITTLRELKATYRVVWRGLLLLLPFALLQFAELFVLPIDFFTFRIWEAALSIPYRYPGQYYPNLHIQKEREYGDQYRQGGIHSEVSKPVEWFTDSYGWRNRPEVEQKKKYDVVIVGDSNIVGSFLDQKNTISEVLAKRSGKVTYSYSIGHDKVSLYFSDERMRHKGTNLLVVESKLGNWVTNNSYPINFRENADGSLEVVDRSPELQAIYDPNRNYLFEFIDSQLSKRAMFHWLKASLAASFSVVDRDPSLVFFGTKIFDHITNSRNSWSPLNWINSNNVIQGLNNELQPAFKIQAIGGNSYWKTERFIASNAEGNITLRFEAKNSFLQSMHRLWIHESGAYRSIGEFVVNSSWQNYEIPISTKVGSELELQIDLPDNAQWLSIRNFRVEGGRTLPKMTGVSTFVPLTGWSAPGETCVDTNSVQCRHWGSNSSLNYIQSTGLPQPGAEGMIVRFEARSDKSASASSPVYLFEGDKYSAVTTYFYGKDWREYKIFLRPTNTSSLKLQFDYPAGVEWLEIRNFQVMPVESLWTSTIEHKPTSEQNQSIAISSGTNVENQIKSNNVTSDVENYDFSNLKNSYKQLNPYPKPENLTPLDGSGKPLTKYESQYYFYHATKAMELKAQQYGMDLIMYVMPDMNMSRLMPAVNQLRNEGVKVIAYEPGRDWQTGVDDSWYWQKTDSHWSEAAVRLTADEILRMWENQQVANRPFSVELREAYASGFPNSYHE